MRGGRPFAGRTRPGRRGVVRMAWRKWLVRGLVFSVGGLLLLGFVLYQTWTNPAAVRRLVLGQLGVRFVHVSVQVESARLRLLGGIAVSGLRMARSDGLDRDDFLFAPNVLIYHDKEQVLDGKLAVRQVELSRPQLRLVRERDGRLNLSGILGEVDLTERLPTLVIRQGTLVIEDRAAASPGVVLEIRDVQLTVINDPALTLNLEATGQTDVAGPVKLRGTVDRATFETHLHVEFPEVPVGPALVQRLAERGGDCAVHLRHLSGAGKLALDLAYRPEAPRPLAYEVTAGLDRGQFSHARLPLTVTNLQAEARCVDGVVPLARLTGRAGPARVEVTARDIALPAHPPEGEVGLDDLARRLDARVEHLPVTEELLKRLPPELRWVEEDYSPAGQVSVAFHVRREGGQLRERRWVFTGEGAEGVWSAFRYKLDRITGTVEVETAFLPRRQIRLDLVGYSGDRPVRVRGTIDGPKETSEVDVHATAEGVPLDGKLFDALRRPVQKVAEQFMPRRSREGGLNRHPMGRADVRAHVYRPGGQREFRNEFVIDFHDTSVLYEQFPLPLGGVTGRLKLYPDHWECSNFRGHHAGGEIRVDARSYRLPPAGPGGDEHTERVRVVIRGKDIPLDREFTAALAPPQAPERKALQSAWQTLALEGRMSFAAEVVDHPGQPQDIDVGVDIHGCTMRPTFFPYALDVQSGSVRYAGGRVYLGEVRARHAGGELGLKSGLLQLKPAGGFVAWLRGIRGARLEPDEEFRSALPLTLRHALERLHLRGPFDVETDLTLDAGPGPGGRLKVWWEGGARLTDAGLRAGVEATGVTGSLSCRGYHDGERVQQVAGDLLFERTSVLGQPLKNVHARLEVLPESPDVLRLRDLKADLFGGTVGGEARVELAPVLRYDVALEAVGVELEQFGKQNLGAESAQAQLKGPARAALHLMGEGDDLIGLRGNGRVDVSGQMGRLPLQLDLLKAFGLRMPDRTAFEQAHVVFAVEGPRVRVKQLDLLGNAVSLRGEGTVDLDGNNVNLDFSATPGRVREVLPAVIDGIPQAISEQMLKIKMRGRLGKEGGVRFEKELAPGVVEPIRRALGAWE